MRSLKTKPHVSLNLNDINAGLMRQLLDTSKMKPAIMFWEKDSTMKIDNNMKQAQSIILKLNLMFINRIKKSLFSNHWHKPQQEDY